MSDPLVPNFKKGVGRLATDRFDFEDHIEGIRFRHKANQIDLVPTITIGGGPKTNVQDAIASLATLILPPSVPDATSTVKGIIRLSGDLNASISGGTALNPKVTGLQGFPIANTAPVTGYVLTWTGSTWAAQPIVSSFTPGNDLAGTASSQNVVGLTGVGAPPNATVTAKNDVIQFIASATPIITQTVAASGDGTDFYIIAQNGNPGDSGHGGSILIQGGEDGFESHVNGGAAFILGDGTYMVEAVGVDNSGSGSKVLSLLNDDPISATQLPANTGSRIIYIADTSNTPSSGSPVSGSILYSSAGRLFIKQSNSQNFQITPNYLPTRTVVGNTTVGVSDVVMLVDTSSLSISVTLPTPEVGRRVIVKDSKGFASIRNISIVRFGAEKIEGLAATKIIAANWGSATLASDGTDWFIV